MEKLWTGAAIMKRFGWSESTFYRHIKNGRFPRGRNFGGKIRWTEADLDAYVLLAGRWEPQDFEPPKKEEEDDEEEGV